MVIPIGIENSFSKKIQFLLTKIMEAIVIGQKIVFQQRYYDINN